MKKTALILAAIASAAAFATAPAQAGPRLQFGGPLGSFEATPYAKSTPRGHSSQSKTHASHSAAKAAARRAAAQEAHARKLAGQKAAAKMAAERKYAAQKAAQQKLAANKAAAAKTRNLAVLRNTEAKPVATAVTANEEAKSAPVKASAIAGTNTLEFESEDNQDTDVAALANTETAKTEAVDEKAELECKKYIPSAGLTITVPCGS